MYNLKFGGESNHPKAKELYEKSCDGGYAYACNTLGLWYESGGEGVEQNIPKAKELYKKACDGGDTKSCEALDDFNKKDKK